jgi:predicted nucleotidyltransferase
MERDHVLILVEVDPAAHIGLFGYVAVMQYLEDLFPIRVDVANRKTLRDAIRPSVLKDAVYAF